LNKKPSKDDALEALDFIINVLKEHEKDLDRLINELGVITEKIGDKGEYAEKIERVEERLSLIQTELTELIKFLSLPGGKPPAALAEAQAKAQAQLQVAQAKAETAQMAFTRGPPVIVRCKQWEDFKLLASEADTISFLYKDAEKTFQADVLKNGRVITYNGALPENPRLLKAWLARELGTSETKIFEGLLAIG
jgi:DNA repair exonuclease SbcCD ATPase subunit